MGGGSVSDTWTMFFAGMILGAGIAFLAVLIWNLVWRWRFGRTESELIRGRMHWTNDD